MGTRDERIDAYIARSAEFARPILEHLREQVHENCPEVVETMKWSSPSFEYEGLLCSMAAFKRHCTFGFWKHSLVVGEPPARRGGVGDFGKLESLEDLPSKAQLARYVKKAAKLNQEGVKVARPKKAPRKLLPMPPELKAALAKNARAKATYEGFSPSAKREYLEWVSEAKRDATRTKRVAQAVEWMAEGKRRNWKYESC